MLWHNNPSPSILMVNVVGSPEEPTDLPSSGQQRLFLRDSDGRLCRLESDGSVTDIEATRGIGQTVQIVNTETGAEAHGTTVIPMDDTPPQSGEGTQFLTLSITPTDSANKLKIDVVVNCSHSAGPSWIIAALFQDSGTSAIAAATNFESPSGGGGTGSCLTFTHYMTAGTDSLTTFKVRVGGSAAGTVTLNGAGSSRFLGGVYASSLTITEIQV